MVLAAYTGFNEGVKIGWYLSLVGIVVALLLIIISLVMFVKKKSGWGVGLLITGAVAGGISKYWYDKLNKPAYNILLDNAFDGIKSITGRHEEFDGDTIINVSDDCGCGMDSDINEIDGGNEDINYINNDIPLFKGGSDTQYLKKILEVINDDDLHQLSLKAKSDSEYLDMFYDNLDNIKSHYDKLDEENKSTINNYLNILDTDNNYKLLSIKDAF